VCALQQAAEELPSVHPAVQFITVQADAPELVSVSQGLQVTEFPTFVLLRKGQEVPASKGETSRASGTNRIMEKVQQLLTQQLTNDDVSAYKEKRRREKEAAGPEAEEEVP